jgi:uncharacterized membrane protein
MTKSRLEAFADGVFAIAATLLVLSVDAQVPSGGRDLRQALLDIWPSYVAYVLSFVTIGILWINHHTVMHQVGHVDRTFLFLSVGLLMAVSFVPFPTRLVAEHIQDDGAQAAALAYGITLTSTATFFNALWLYASRNGRLLRPDADRRVVSGITRSYLPGPFIYLGATLVALVNAGLSVALFVVIAIFYVVDSALFGNRAERDAEAGTADEVDGTGEDDATGE